MDKNFKNTDLSIPLLADPSVKPIYVGDLPLPMRNTLDEMASSLLLKGGGRLFVNGVSGSGKSFVIQQFAYNVDEYLDKIDLERLVFLELNTIHLQKAKMIPGGLDTILEVYKNILKIESEELCVVTENIELATALRFIDRQIKVIVEVSNSTYESILKGELVGGNKMWGTWDSIDVDKIYMTEKELIDLMASSILPLPENINFGRREISLFINFMIGKEPAIVADVEDGKKRVIVPPGLWHYAFRKIIGLLAFSEDPKLQNKSKDIVYSRVMSEVSKDIFMLFGHFGFLRPPKVPILDITGKTPEEIIAEGYSGFTVVNPDNPLLNKEIMNPADVYKFLEDVNDSKNKVVFKDFVSLEDRLKKVVMGQDSAIHSVVNRLIVPAAGINDESKPLGTFLFAGKSGVGKTSLAYALSKELLSKEMNVLRLDMSEYGREHEAAKLFGAPPGYVGHSEGGILTNGIKKNPVSIILLDEVEKANPLIWDSFLQVFDAGRMTDSNGDTVDFSKTIIIMTSNLGVKELSRKHLGFGAEKNIEEVNKDNSLIISKAIKDYFRPEFVNRIGEIVFFGELSKDIIYEIIEKELKEIEEKLSKLDVNVDIDTKVVDKIYKLSNTSDYGAREIQRVISRNITSLIADRMVRSGDTDILLTLDKDGQIVIK